jgi:4-hydroxy-3-polyprenylbenzoate decarboxylase
VSTSSLLIAITGASGGIYGLRLLERAAESLAQVNLVVSRRGAQVLRHETGVEVDLEALTLRSGGTGYQPVHAALPAPDRVRLYHPDDLEAPFASGSNACDAMAIVPCSMGTTGRIACGFSNDLITRAADVMLKERRPLVLAPRETPLSLIHLRNLTTLCEAGAVILPAMPAFYTRPERIEDLVDFVVERALRHLGIESAPKHIWKG